MKTLWSLVESEAQILGELVEKKPSKVARSNPNAFAVRDDIPLKEKVIQLLNSDLLSQVCWALSKIGRLLESHQVGMEIVETIPPLFRSKYAKLEYYAVIAAISILKANPGQYKSVFLKPICTQISQAAYAEYIVCFKLMEDYITDDEATNIIWPTVTKIMEKNSTSCSHCALKILTIIDSRKFLIQQDEFAKLFKYPIFVNEYILDVTANFHKLFGDNWLYNEVPNTLAEICSKDSVYKKGFTAFIAKYPSRITTASLYSKIMDCFQWSESDMDIALILLKHADDFMQSRYTSLASSILTLARTVASSSNHQAQINLFPILLEQDYLLNGVEFTTKFIFESLGKEKDIDVTLAFIKNANDIYKKTKLQSMKDLFMGMFSSKFLIENQKVKEALAESPMLSSMHDYGSHVNTGHVVDLCEYFYNRWRYYTKCMNAIELYSPLLLHSFTTKLLNIVESAVTLNPQVLTDVTIKFYVRIILEFTETISPRKFASYLWSTYGKSTKYELRRLYLTFAQRLLSEVPSDFYLEHIWTHIREFKNEKCSLVRIRLMEYLMTIEMEYPLTKFPNVNADFASIIDTMDDEKDPQAKELINQVKSTIVVVVHEQPKMLSIPRRPHTPSKLPCLSNGRAKLISPRTRAGKKENENGLRSSWNPVRKSPSIPTFRHQKLVY